MVARDRRGREKREARNRLSAAVPREEAEIVLQAVQTQAWDGLMGGSGRSSKGPATIADATRPDVRIGGTIDSADDPSTVAR